MASSEIASSAEHGAGFEVSRLLQAAGFTHAFFTRRGGVSTGPYASLSFSLAAGDEEAHVVENLRRAGRVLGVDAAHLYYLSQVHGREVIELHGGEDRDAVLHREGDALISRATGLACGVRYADCVPVLLADRASGAVAAVHAGWRGVACGVVRAALLRLRALAGGSPDLIAAVGPHISARAFEVSPEVAEELRRASDAERPVVEQGGRPHVDLRCIVRAQLRAAGVHDAAIDDVGGCTVNDPDRYFSFRRDGAASGRHVAAIVARG